MASSRKRISELQFSYHPLRMGNPSDKNSEVSHLLNMSSRATRLPCPDAAQKKQGAQKLPQYSHVLLAWDFRLCKTFEVGVDEVSNLSAPLLLQELTQHLDE